MNHGLWLGGCFTDYQLGGKGASQWLSSSNSILGMRTQYEWSVQEEKAWRKMLFITVFFGFAANVDNILENIVEEGCRIFNITQYMKGKVHLPNVGAGVEGDKDG